MPVLGYLLHRDGAERVLSSAPEKNLLCGNWPRGGKASRRLLVSCLGENAWKLWTGGSGHFCLLEAQTSYHVHRGCQQANHCFGLCKFKRWSASGWQELWDSFFLARGNSRSEQRSRCWPLGRTRSVCWQAVPKPSPGLGRSHPSVRVRDLSKPGLKIARLGSLCFPGVLVPSPLG